MGHDQGQTDGQGTAQGGLPSSSGSVGTFDGYDITDVALGDLMRGERATFGKSLLDVERELKIRAAYIAAIENGDVGAFSSPGFIAGYVRSYARYLGMEPEWTFRRFCDETGFHGVHGPSGQQAKAAKREMSAAPTGRVDPNDVIQRARISYTPQRESLFSGIEPGALGSFAVLVALVMGLGYGAWSILHDIQRLQNLAGGTRRRCRWRGSDPLAGEGTDAFDVTQSFDVDLPRRRCAGAHLPAQASRRRC